MAESRVAVLLENVRRTMLNDPVIGTNAGSDGVIIGTARPPAFPVRTPFYVVRDEGVRTECDAADALHEVIGLAVDVYQQLRGGRGDEMLLLGGGGSKGLLELAAEVEELLDGNVLARFAEVVKTGESACEVVGEKSGECFGRRTMRFDVFAYCVVRE